MISTNSNSSVLALGELLWDVLPSERLLGGAPANFCYRLRQLGVPALIVSRVGQDALGDELLAGLSEKNFVESWLVPLSIVPQTVSPTCRIWTS